MVARRGSRAAAAAVAGALDGTERLDIYNRAYRARLFECFAAEFPALGHALGEDLFRAFVGAYLEAHPPTGYTVGRLGAGLADYLEATRPDGAQGEHPDWPDFLVDLVRLERLRLEVYDGEGPEELPPAGADRFLGISHEAFLALRVEVVPGLRLLDVRFPVDEYLLAVRRGESPELPTPAPRHLAVYRRDWRVRLLRLDGAEAAFLSRLLAGDPVGVALDASSVDGAAARTRLLAWADEGLFLPSTT